MDLHGIVDDYGLAQMVYQLMTGQADLSLVPGLELLIHNEAAPGGLIHRQCQREAQALQDFLQIHPELAADGSLKALLSAHDRTALSGRLGEEMFRYGSVFAALVMYVAHQHHDSQAEFSHWCQSFQDGEPLDQEELTRYVSAFLRGFQKLYQTYWGAAKWVGLHSRPPQS